MYLCTTEDFEYECHLVMHVYYDPRGLNISGKVQVLNICNFRPYRRLQGCLSSVLDHQQTYAWAFFSKFFAPDPVQQS